MPAEDHAPAARSAARLTTLRRSDELELQAPLGRELRVLSRHPLVLEAEVVVLRALRVAAS